MTERDHRFDFVEFPAASVDGIADAKRFYGEVFGWRWQDWGDDYADTHDGGLGAGLNADPAHRPNAPLLVIYAAHLEEARSRVIAANGIVTRDIFSFPGGRRFHFRDPAGNELAVWSDIEQ